jgi:hypothetical protein
MEVLMMAQASATMLRAYDTGKALQGKSLDDIVWGQLVPDAYFTNDALSLFFEAGYNGYPLPIWARGWRYGRIPACGRSTNFREGHAEAGVSVMEIIIEGGERRCTQDKISAMFFSGDIVEVEGWLHYRRGSDGEPLLVGCREITR